MERRKFPYIEDYTIRNAKVRWRNFAGREEQYNAAGSRNCTLFLEEHDANRLTELGLNVKALPQKADDEGNLLPIQYILRVKVNFKGRPPRLVMVTHRGRTNLDEASAGLLDMAQIARDETKTYPDGKPLEKVDLVLSPYWYEMNGREGVAVSLKAIYMTIVEDELEMEYGDLPEASSALRSFDYDVTEEDLANMPQPSGPQFR